MRDRDERCRLTRDGDGIERAHLCPRSAADWFTREEMERYNMSTTLSGATSVDDMANAIALREDVHTQLDKGISIFVRKHGKWVTHFLDPTKDLGPKYHNVPIDMPAAVREASIFVNIAKALLSRSLNFLIRGEKRKVIVKRGAEPQQIREMSGKEIQTLLDQPKRQRSESPRKRSRNPVAEDEPGDAPDARCPCLSYSSEEDQEILETPLSTPPPASIEQLRLQELKRQRRQNTNICCDYDAAEAALRNKDFRAKTVCNECLGTETSQVEIIEDEE